MEPGQRVRISKLLSLALRHDPGALGIALDASGWTAVDDLVRAVSARGEPVSRADIEEVVRTSDKQRFALSPDGARIRANQGHSVNVDLGLPPGEPPTLLFHGTALRFVESIRRDGLVRGARTHVHLSSDRRTAEIVAARRRGPREILVVHAGEMHADGQVLRRSENGVWLAEHVPVRYIDFPDP